VRKPKTLPTKFFESLAKRFRLLRKGLPFSSWLYRIARNLVIDRYRKANPVVNIDEEFVSEKLIFRPDLSSIDDKKISRIMSSIQQLKDVERDVVIMRFVEDMSIKEVSETIVSPKGQLSSYSIGQSGKSKKYWKNNKERLTEKLKILQHIVPTAISRSRPVFRASVGKAGYGR
jgi:hypothetical protein